MKPIQLLARDAQELALWRAADEIANAFPVGSWTLIGAQMVFLLAYEHGLVVGRTSGDVDMLVNIRALTGATQAAAGMLERLGYELDEPTPDGRGHRFRRADAVVDVLAPDGVGSRASLITVPPARTVNVPGGSQALARSRQVGVELEGKRHTLPCPSLLGAILLKARAVEVGEDADKHRRDLALLLSALEDPRSLREELSASEKGWLRRRQEMLAISHPAWRGVGRGDDARTSLEILAG
ncbi:MAG: hypothetical protein HYX52_01575 [Chloroflexi bacterium]|nr:hypothetical protein [Chloroflexota bacterium]